MLKHMAFIYVCKIGAKPKVSRTHTALGAFPKFKMNGFAEMTAFTYKVCNARTTDIH